MRTVVFKVHGMTCEGCARTVASHLKKDPGVIQAVVDWRQGKAVVTYDPALTSPERLLAMPVFGLAYRATVEEEPPSSEEAPPFCC
jgi:copper chaperone CopZ